MSQFKREDCDHISSGGLCIGYPDCLCGRSDGFISTFRMHRPFEPELFGWSKSEASDPHNPHWWKDGILANLKRDGEYLKIYEVLPDGDSAGMTVYFARWPSNRVAQIILAEVLDSRLKVDFTK